MDDYLRLPGLIIDITIRAVCTNTIQITTRAVCTNALPNFYFISRRIHDRKGNAKPVFLMRRFAQRLRSSGTSRYFQPSGTSRYLIDT